MLLVVCFQSYTDGEIQYLFFAQTARCQLTITDSESALPLFKSRSARNEPVLCAASYPQDGRRDTELEWLSTARQKQDGGLVPWREDHRRRPIPEGPRGWVDSAQAAMETEPAGAFPHSCFVVLVSLSSGTTEDEKKRRGQRHVKSEEGFCVWWVNPRAEPRWLNPTVLTQRTIYIILFVF